MGTTSQLILKYLERHQTASCSQIGRGLNISRANAHYHISNFIEHGLVEQLPQAVSHLKRGRPTKLYQLSKQAHPDALLNLTTCLLAEFDEHGKTNDEKRTALIAIARRLTPPLEIDNTATVSFPRLLNTIIFCLNEKGYKASWETHRGGPQITFRNCPYLPLVTNHPVICEIDTLILQEMVGSTYQIKDVEVMSKTSEKLVSCKFSFQARQT
jgi:predicted ArsR family transcriptional regulator